MKIIIEEKDWKILSKNTKNEILAIYNEAPEELSHDDIEDDLLDLTPKSAKNFMSNMSENSKSCLRILAENNGKATIDQLLKATGYSNYQDLRGVFAGLTRRARRFDTGGDGEARLLEWVQGDTDDDDDGHFKVSDRTKDALVNYFKKH